MILRFIIEFLVYSFIGWIIDTTFVSITKKKWTNSGRFKGSIPVYGIGALRLSYLCPIYGFGALTLIYLIGITEGISILLRALIFVIALTLIEYIGALFGEKVLKRKIWDYSERKIHLHGRISLFHSTCWLVLSLLFTYIIYPLFSPLLPKLDILSPLDPLFFSIFIIISIWVVIKEREKIMNEYNKRMSMVKTGVIKRYKNNIERLAKEKEILKQRLEKIKNMNKK